MKCVTDRFPDNPIIFPEMQGLEGELGGNINGPCLIKVPNWIKNPLGLYYLYFAHHKGTYIRLAYSHSITGPYSIYPEGSLKLGEIIKQTDLKPGHIASPEIIIREDEKEIWMYYHASVKGIGIYKNLSQMTFLAKSKDGIHFFSEKEQLAPFYLRVFDYHGYVYGLAKNDNKNGVIVRSRTGQSIFEKGRCFIKGFRHNSVLVQGDTLWLFYSRVGDKPERILLSQIDLKKDWKKWKPSKPIEILRPMHEWEGTDLPLEKSKHGSTKPTQALRDPYVYSENNQLYLLYSVKGEQGIAIAKMMISDYD
jgi:hypothetical protein